MVYLRDADGYKKSCQTSNDGHGAFDISNSKPPFVIWTRLTSLSDGGGLLIYTTFDQRTEATVNLNSLTHLAMAMALGRDPVDYYAGTNNMAPAPDAAKLATANQTINTVLAQVYADYGIASNFDLIKDDVGTPGSGYRRIIDLVKGVASDYSCALYSRLAQARLLWDDDMRDGMPVFTVGPEAAWIILNGMPAAAQYFDMLNEASEEGGIDRTEQAAITSWWAAGYLNRGLNADQSQAALTEGRTERVDVMPVVDYGYYRLLYGPSEHPVTGISEKGPYAKGFWCYALHADRDRYYPRMYSFVLTNGKWKVYGDRSPFDDRNAVRSVGLRLPTETYLTGLNLAIKDETHIGQDLGIRKVAIFNGALPEIVNPMGAGTAKAVVLAPHRFGAADDIFRIAEPAGLAAAKQGLFYLTDDGLNLEVVRGSRHCYLVALGEDNTPLYVWAEYLEQEPETIESLRQNAALFFPTLTAVGGAAPSNQLPYSLMTGALTVAWQPPVEESEGGAKVLDARLEWWNEADDTLIAAGAQELHNPAFTNGALSFQNWSAAAFAPPPQSWQQRKGRISVCSYGGEGAIYIDAIDFEVVAGAAQ
jgi:hypothetical protein